MAATDTKGPLLSFTQIIAGYARAVGTFDEARIQQILDTAQTALEDGLYFAVNS